MPPQVPSSRWPQPACGGVVVLVGGPPGVVVVDVPQPEVHDWKSEAHVFAADCAADAQPWRQESRSDPVPHPAMHVLASAVTARAHEPRFSPQLPRQAAVEGSADDGAGGLHAWTQLVSLFRQVV